MRVLAAKFLKWWFWLDDIGLNTPTLICHAVAVDEQRKDFRHVSLNEVFREHAPNMEEKWFVGSHGDLGGTCIDRRLANIPLKWIVDRATDAGIRFTDHPIVEQQDHLAPVNESRKGFWLFRGRSKRVVNELGHLHDSVLNRTDADDTYQPMALASIREHLTKATELLTGNVAN